MRRAVALVLGTFLVSGAAVALAGPKRGSATEVEHGQCVKRSRDTQRSCIDAATIRCREAFETDLVQCFHSDAECPRKCLTAHTSCRAAPKATEDGCKLACASDLKVSLAECRKKADIHGCEGPARVKALECKQRCSVQTAPKIQECVADFDDCIGACVRSAAH